MVKPALVRGTRVPERAVESFDDVKVEVGTGVKAGENSAAGAGTGAGTGAVTGAAEKEVTGEVVARRARSERAGGVERESPG